MPSLWENSEAKEIVVWLTVDMRSYPQNNGADDTLLYGRNIGYGIWVSIINFMNAAQTWGQWSLRGTFEARFVSRAFRSPAGNKSAGPLYHLLHRDRELPSLPSGLIPDSVLQKLPAYGRSKFSTTDVDKATAELKRLIAARVPEGESSASTAEIDAFLNTTNVE
ncbi:hypothetical protein OCU04_006191 [Sclerotinia nivalis]|uniref:Uncharacterized protein n=1 Tax=Sclerotinia nivalis TaxID=352851 RepID=A0A9X0AML0_9HELO|nr:hypothetical protein OCU04_006191 [Sclerotinia nivalis]